MKRILATALVSASLLTLTACSETIDVAKHVIGLEKTPSVEEAIVGYWLADDGESFVFDKEGKVVHDDVNGSVTINEDTIHIVYPDATVEDFTFTMDFDSKTLTLDGKEFYGDSSRQNSVRENIGESHNISAKIGELQKAYDEYVKENMPDAKSYASKISEAEYQIKQAEDTIADCQDNLQIAEGYIAQYKESMKDKPTYTLTVDEEGNEVQTPIEEPDFIKTQREAVKEYNTKIAELKTEMETQKRNVEKLREERLNVLTEFYEVERFYLAGPVDSEARTQIESLLGEMPIYFPYEDAEYILVLDAKKQYTDDDGFVQYGKSSESWLYVKADRTLYTSDGVAVS